MYSLCETQGKQWNSVCNKERELFVPFSGQKKLIIVSSSGCCYRNGLYLCFFLFFPLGIYLWLFSSNRCSSKTSIRIRQLWKYLWAEKCTVGIISTQWHGPHPSEVSRLWLNGERCGNLQGEGASCFSYCYKDNILLKIIFICFLLVFFLTVHLNHFWFWSINTFTRKQN